SWNPWGQRPVAFVALWQRLVNAVRAATPAGSVAFIWAPSVGDGYPFPANGFNPFTSSNEFAVLDTNGDGTLDASDDPYTPYYPGAAYVDWVG
ncbi:hypothetical protein BDK51DRAFT_21154, partial [Blyttiomyces helicus]